MSFIHLHVHSYYSFLDGAASLSCLLDKAAALGMPALALTDHNRLTGAIRFYEKARSLGLKPIIGAEIDMENGHHLVLLCKNRAGYSNLCRLLTAAHCSNNRSVGKPFVTRKTLSDFNNGLIVLSGCERGEIPTLLKAGNRRDAAAAAGFYRDIFKEDFFIELTRYPAREGSPLCYQLSSFAREQQIPAVATNNVHYAEMKDYRLKELLNAIGLIVPVANLPGKRSVEQYLKSGTEMQRLFQDFPGAVEMTAEIASRCNLEFELGHSHFPSFEPPQGETAAGFLRKLAVSGVERKYGKMTPQLADRLEMELATIEKLGFCTYFLVVWDIVRWARLRGIRCLARGSAVDSLVVYALDISIADPIHYNLLFERFMHPLRREPPDIDLDIDRRRRDEVRDYICQKYGSDNVACVATINTYMARGAIRDAGKALKLPQTTIEEACKGIHYLSASNLLEKADSLPELKDSPVYKRPDLQEFFLLCASIDGFPKHLSVHLGGLLIGESRLSEIVPLEPSSGGDIISQYDKDDIERLGLVKMDLLALPTLTVIEDSLRNIRVNRSIGIDIDKIPFDDEASFAMLRDSRTIGIFQLESPAQREMAGRLLPRNFDDIIVSISLVRPGPLKSSMDKVYLARRHGREQVSFMHPGLKGALEETLGVILYQEQVLRVAHDLAGMSYAEADGFRRAMTHDRTHEEMEKMRNSFISSARKNGVSRQTAEIVYEQLAAFAAYGFCKAHAVAYAVLAYQTLWLKCHYPAEFFAALLSNQPVGYYPPRVLIADARRHGVTVLPPDVNKSQEHYSVEGDALRVSLGQVKGITAGAIASIIRERGIRPFDSLRDFVQRASVSHPIMEKLIRVGAFDAFGSREDMLSELPELLQYRYRNYRSTAGMFKDAPAMPAGCTLNKKESLLAERELLSLDLSAHPLDFCTLDRGFIRIENLPSLHTGQTVKIAGSVIRYQTPPTRSGKRVVYIILEDGSGVADVTVFKDVQDRCGSLLFRAGWLEVHGKIQRRGAKSLSIIATDVRPLRQHSNSTSTGH